MSNNGKMNKVFRDFHINKNADKFFGNLQKKRLTVRTSLNIACLALHAITFRITSCSKQFEKILLAYKFMDITH